MKKLFFMALLALVSCASADGLKSLERFYDEVDSFNAHFDQVVLDEGLNLIEESSGQMWISRPGRFRWDYAPPLEQTISSNGNKVWVFDPDLEQVIIRVMDTALGETPAILLAGRGDLEHGYDLIDLGLQGAVEWVGLRPKASDSAYEDIRIGFEDNTLRMIVLIDGLGQRTRISLYAAAENPGFDNKLFNFEIPPGVDVIDETQ